MNNGDICLFQIPFNEDVYAVRCECYDSYVNDFGGSLAYGNTYYKNGEEILHAGFGQMIDSLGKAKEALGETLELLKKLKT